MTNGDHNKYLKRFLSKNEMRRVQGIFPNGEFEKMWDKLFLMYDYFDELETEVSKHFNFVNDKEETKKTEISLKKEGFGLGFIDYLKKLINGYVINQVKNINLPQFYPSPTVRKNIVFSGRVQKVGFRIEIYELAKRLNLSGWAKNRKDKNVEAELQGEDEKIIFLVKYMEALKRASVQEVIINEIPIIHDDAGFSMLKG